MYPDFTIKDRTRGLTFYWEHLMALDDPHYCEHSERTRYKYLAAGIAPLQEGSGPNGALIETSDEPDGSLNIAMIDKLIEGILQVAARGVKV
jgi:hypothetical protein